MTFCVLPFLGLYIHTNGDVGACCHSFPNKESVMGNVKFNSIESIYNNEKFKKFRLDLKNNIPRPDICKKCYLQEELNLYSFRQHHNDTYKQDINDLLSQTDDNGNIIPKIKYLDFRFSNLCNMKCRTCYSELSSSIAAENKNKSILIKASDDNINLLKYQFDNIEKIYFAGGEPLIMQEHAELINYLIKKEYSSNIELSYNTNLSVLNYKNNNFLEKWKYFKNVNISVSIDNICEKAEYIRHGTKWTKIENNIKNLKNKNINLGFNTVVSILNVKDIPLILRYFKNKELIKNYNDFNLSILIYPLHLRISNLPEELKTDIYHEYNEFLKNTDLSNNIKIKFETILNTLQKERNEHEFNKFVIFTKLIDKKRKENILKIFPHFEKYFQ